MTAAPPPRAFPYRTVLTLATVLAGGWLLYLLGPILTPFLLAAVIAYLCDPLVDRLEAHKLGRTLGTLLVLTGLVLVFVLLILILTPLVQAQLRLFVQQIPGLVQWAGNTVLPWLSASFGVDLSRDQAEILAWLRSHISELTRLTPYLPKLAGSGLALLGFVVNLLLVPVVLFYLLRDWDIAMAHLATWLPDRYRNQVVGFAREIDTVLSQFVRGQVLVILIMALFYSVGLWFTGLSYALAVGLVSGLLVFVPYLGVVVGVLLGTLAAWAQFGELSGLLSVWGVFAVGQLLEGMVITPWLVGEKVGLHPVAVIFALMAFGQLLGFVGVLIAIPAAAVSVVALGHLKRQLD